MQGNIYLDESLSKHVSIQSGEENPRCSERNSRSVHHSSKIEEDPMVLRVPVRDGGGANLQDTLTPKSMNNQESVREKSESISYLLRVYWYI